jgi:hypothetical protein
MTDKFHLLTKLSLSEMTGTVLSSKFALLQRWRRRKNVVVMLM